MALTTQGTRRKRRRRRKKKKGGGVVFLIVLPSPLSYRIELYNTLVTLSNQFFFLLSEIVVDENTSNSRRINGHILIAFNDRDTCLESLSNLNSWTSYI